MEGTQCQTSQNTDKHAYSGGVYTRNLIPGSTRAVFSRTSPRLTSTSKKSYPPGMTNIGLGLHVCLSASVTCHVPPRGDLQPQPTRSQDDSIPTPAPDAASPSYTLTAPHLVDEGLGHFRHCATKSEPQVCAPSLPPEAAAPGPSCSSCLGQAAAAAAALTAPQLPIKF